METIRGDRTDYAAFERQMREAGTFDAVIDMVGYAPEDAQSAIRAFRGRITHFVFCSTVDVYQKPASRYPVTESEGYSGRNAYSINKIACEKMLTEAQQRGDFALTIIRPAYTYGEGRGPSHTFGQRASYVDRIRKGKPIVVHGDGSAIRPACYRDDVGRAFAEAVGNAAVFGKSYHVAGAEWMPWNVYHQIVAEAIGAPPPMVHIPTDVLARVAPERAKVTVENYQFHGIFDTGAAERDLNFRYTVPWREGVRRMVDWLDRHNRIEDSDADPFEDRLIEAWRKLEGTLCP